MRVAPEPPGAQPEFSRLFADAIRGTAARRELVLIDRDVPDRNALARELVASRPAGTAVEVVELCGGGLAEVGTILARYRGLNAVHLVTHGEAGALTVGGDRLDAASLARHAPDLRAWGSSLAADADLLLYGCDFAGSDAGRGLADRIAALTGADVAASTDLTGATALGGDWDLEYRTADVEATVGAGTWANTLGAPSGVLITTVGDVSASGSPGLNAWTAGTVISVAGPNLALEPGGTSGTFSPLFNINQFAQADVKVDALHYVRHAITVGSGPASLSLLPGDLLLSIGQDNKTLSSQNALTVDKGDVFVFRPAAGGNYSTGTFLPLLSNFKAVTGGNDTWAISLVYTDTVVGDVTLRAGSFLYARQGGSEDNDVRLFVPTGVGVGTTAGATSVLIEGDHVGIGPKVFGIDLVEATTTVGGRTIAAGTLLFALDSSDNSVGTNGLAVTQYDIAALDVSRTSRNGTASATASLLFRGADVGLNSGSEAIRGFSLGAGGTGVPAANGDSYAATEDAPLTVPATGGVLGNDSDPDGDPLTASLATGPAHGTVALSADGGFTYTPNANYFGPDSFTYTVSDGRGGTATGTVGITVVPLNDAPTFSLTAAQPTVDEDAGPQTVAGFATGMAPGPANEGGQALAFRVTSNTNPALFAAGPAVAPDGTLTYTPAANASGTATITLVLGDDGGTANGGQDTSPARTFTITVRAVNDAPALDPIGAATIGEDAGSQSVPLAGISAGRGEAQPLAVTATSSDPSLIPNPTVAYTDGSATGTLVFAPTADASGTATITVTVRDAGLNGFLGDADDALVIRQFAVAVLPAPDAPVANPDTYSTPGGVLLNILGTGVLGNDMDADGDPLSAVLVGTTANGVLVLGGGGSFTYLPNLGFSGTDTFTYRAVDPATNTSATTTVTINVALGNRPPTAIDDAFTTAEDATLVGDVTGNDTDPDGDPLTVTLLSGPAHGTLALNPGGSFTFAPDAGWSGTDSFTYTLSDGQGNSSIAAATLTVTPVNDAPTATADAATATEDDSVTIAVRSNDTDPENDPLTVAAVTRPANGTTTTDGFTVTYTPNADFSGVDSFTYTISDGRGGIATATVTVTVNPVNDAPTLDPIADVVVSEDAGPQSVSLAGISAGGGEAQPLTVTATSSDPNLIPNPTVSYGGSGTMGTLNFTPATDASGTATLTVIVSDGVTTTSRTLVVTVAGVNDAPTITPILAQTVAEDGVLGPIAFTVGDVETPPGALTVTATSSNPALVPDAGITIRPAGGRGRQLTLVPTADASGTALITLTVSDGSASTTTTFTLTVTAVADAPTAADDVYSTPRDTRLAVPPGGGLANDLDADGDPLDAVLVAGPRHGTLQLNPDGSFVYDPDPGFAGVDSFTYRAVDSTGAASGAATVTIRVVAPLADVVPPTVEPARPPAPEPEPSAAPRPPTAPPRLAPTADATDAVALDPAPTGAARAPAETRHPTDENDAGTPGTDAPVFLSAFASSGEPDGGPPADAKPANQLPPEAPRAAPSPLVAPTRPAPPTVEAVAAPAPVTPAGPGAAAEPLTPEPDSELAAEVVSGGADKVSNDVAAEADARAAAGAVVTTAVVATAGYVLLNTRAVYWFVSALLARPAVWSRFDPIDVIYAWERERDLGRRPDGAAEGEAAEGGESLQSMVG